MVDRDHLFGFWKDTAATPQKTDYLLFAPQGLLFISDRGDERSISRLTYEIDGDELVTDQPSAPQVVRTKFWFDESSLLHLDLDGDVSIYERSDAPTGLE